MRISRRSRYLAVGIGLFLLGSIVFNIGFSTNRNDRASDLRSLVSQVSSDLASCHSSVTDSFAAYDDVVNGHPGDRKKAEKVINGNQPYCTPVGNTDLYDLDTLEVPGSLRDYNLQPAVQNLGQWAYPDASNLIGDLGALLANPGDYKARTDLQSQINQMASLNDSAVATFDGAARNLRTTVDNIDLRTPDGLGSGGL